MASILLVCMDLNTTTENLIKTLKAQSHEVTILTSKEASNQYDNTLNLNLMGFFDRFTLVESLKAIPLVLNLRPQIIYFFLEEDRAPVSLMTLALVAKNFGGIVVCTSLMNIRFGLHKFNPVRYIIAESDVVTCPTVETLAELRGLQVRSRKQGRSILPPGLEIPKTSLTFARPSDAEGEKDFFVIPFLEPRFAPHKSFFRRLKLCAQKYRVILWGSYDHWPLRERKAFAHWMKESGLQTRWRVTGQMEDDEALTILNQAKAVVLAGIDLSPIEINEIFAHAIQAKAKIALDSSQS
ncbi:MAG TPA: hypothetical protein PLU50_10430, partial [Pseudobdellovibrionaceae bacterium]|nr:hypothetical protein [Pseudobdellovibrionaceae bacterium]